MRIPIICSNLSICILLLFVTASCVKFPERPPDIPEVPVENSEAFIYDFGSERQNVLAHITITTDGSVSLKQVATEIPELKYNKSWLFLLTQDDCHHAAYSYTWAAINGKPLSTITDPKELYYDAGHLRAGDFPKDTISLGKTLGSTDGTGKEVRFAFTTTLAPENDMDAETEVNVGFRGNDFRFYKKEHLTWSSVIEIANYGNGIAFHNVKKGIDETNIDTLLKHFALSQEIIKKRLSGRGCKILAEPDGIKLYLSAALNYSPIKLMTAQVEAEKLYPYKVKDNLYKRVLERKDYFDKNEPEKTFELVTGAVEAEMNKEKTERSAIHWLVHSTDISSTANVLLWLNDTYGKDGDNSVWFPSLEEYYEYNYYRKNTTIQKSITNDVLKLTIYMPSEQYFYFPSITINLKGIKAENITDISTDSEISGFSFGDFEDGLMMNIDCRKYLVENATYYVKLYEKNKSKANLSDARYFVEMLKDSDIKTGLLNRLK